MILTDRLLSVLNFAVGDISYARAAVMAIEDNVSREDWTLFGKQLLGPLEWLTENHLQQDVSVIPPVPSY